MLDGKVAKAVCWNSASRVCNVCGATPIEMNDIKKIANKESNLEDIELGIKLDNVLINLEKVNDALFHFEKNYLVQDFNDTVLGKHYLN